MNQNDYTMNEISVTILLSTQLMSGLRRNTKGKTHFRTNRTRARTIWKDRVGDQAQFNCQQEPIVDTGDARESRKGILVREQSIVLVLLLIVFMFVSRLQLMGNC